MSKDEIDSLLARSKLALRWSGWEKRSNHAGHLIGTAELFDMDGTTIPGITLEFEVKAAAVADSCLYLFSVMKLTGRNRSRAYQLEVAPADKRTHNGPAPIYGPHEHCGDREPTAVVHPGVNCASWASCTQWFFTRVGAAPIDIPDPFKP